MIGREGVWTRAPYLYLAAGLLAIASSYYLTIAVTGAFVLLLVIVLLSDLMRGQHRAHRELLKREGELRDVVEALRQTEHARALLFDGSSTTRRCARARTEHASTSH
jgi:hypothetical protein